MRRSSWQMVVAGAALMIAGALLMLVGCSRRGEREAPSISAADTLANGVPRALIARLADWSIAWRHAEPRFAPELLVRSGDSPLRFEVHATGREAVKAFLTEATFLDYSPDSTRAVEFDMYVDIAQEGSGLEVEREPDSAPLFADLKSDTVWQVAFCGSPCFFDGAHWLDDEHFTLTGGTQTGANLTGPWCAFLELYDLRAGRVRRWVLPAVNDDQFGRYQTAADSLLILRYRQAKTRS